ncbi:hypothetical protein [Gordonia terrae]
MKRRLTLAAAAFLLIGGISACSDSDNNKTAEATTTVPPFVDFESSPTASVDVEYLTENLPIVAGNIVTTVNNARSQGLENTPPGDVYDVGSYYDELTPECKTKITRTEFRKDFIDRVIPLIDEQEPERITVIIEGTEAVARVEQVSGRTVLMKFEVDGSSDEHACNEDGTVDIAGE